MSSYYWKELCEGAYFDMEETKNTIITCKGKDACVGANISCGYNRCVLKCRGRNSCGGNARALVDNLDGVNRFICRGQCGGD